MTALIIILSIALLAVVIVQIGKVNELASGLRSEEEVEKRQNNTQATWLLVVGILFLIGCVVSAVAYADMMLGYGPHEAASAHGTQLDSLFNVTLFFTGIVFIITHIALFWFSYKYKKDRNRVSQFIPHNNTLEIVWTGIPAVVMTFLVVKGLVAWNDVMTDIGPDEEVIHVEATGWQFAWNLRYPGADGELGVYDFRKIVPGVNELGQDWTDPRNHDDFMADEMVLPVGKKVRVAIRGRDVLHNFYLPHFRVKMDAVPGIPTYFIFTPTKTTEEYRQELKAYPEYQLPADPDDPESPAKWEAFEYELACAELCGKGHYSMRRVVKIVSEEEYEQWLAKQNSYYLTNIHNTDNDPLKGMIVDAEKNYRIAEFNNLLKAAIDSEVEADKIIRLDYVFFNTGSAVLDDKSMFELDNVAEQLKKYPDVAVELSGHTDNVGDPESNLALSKSRAQVVMDYLLRKGVNADRLSNEGYGQDSPMDTNDTAEGRANNRRTELKVL